MSETKKCILLVDDDADYRFQQRIQLTNAGFDVIEAESRHRAEALLDSGGFDLAVVDLMMEEMDAGFILSHTIKKRFPRVPIIMVTAVASETGLEFDAATEEERCWIKADAMLAKPVRFEQLLQEITRLLKG